MPPPSVALLQAQARCVKTLLAGSGGDIVWHVWGEGGGTGLPVVLLHGGSGSWTHWLHSIGSLVQQGREVWAVDIPGFGDSAAVPGAQDVDAVIEPLYQSLVTVLAGRPCDLVGFSFGAMTAGLLEAAHPGTAQVLVLVGAPAMMPRPANHLRLLGWRHLADAQARTQVHRHNLVTLMLHDPLCIDEETLRLHVHNVERDRMVRRRLSNTDVLAQALHAVRCPVHVIYGGHDALYVGHFDDLRAAYAAGGCDLRGFTLVPGAGHWVQHERSQDFLEVLGRALACG